MVVVLEIRFLAWWQTSRHTGDGIRVPGIIDLLPMTASREISVDTVPVAVGNSNEAGKPPWLILECRSSPLPYRSVLMGADVRHKRAPQEGAKGTSCTY
jgi:hypothetical protein